MASVFKRGKKKRGDSWYISWYDHEGQRHTKSAKTTDKATAERIARKYESDAALRRDGVIDPAMENISQESQRSIESHLVDYESKLRAANRTEKHICNTIKPIRWITDHADFRIASDINADRVYHYAGELKKKGRSARTIQAHLTAIKSFTKWLMENHKLPRDPLSSVKKPNPESDRRLKRRMLFPEEWGMLQSYLVTAPDALKISAQERSLIYQTAIQTGLRSSELRSLTRGNLFLTEKQPFITCDAPSTKNKKEARQFIQHRLAEDLRKHVATKAPNANVFQMPHVSNLARMLKADIEATRKMWLKQYQHDAEEQASRDHSDFLAVENSEGDVIDFHSLRHTCGSWLAMSGASPKVVQSVMRHSTITLSMDRYGHLLPGSEAEAISIARKFTVGISDQYRFIKTSVTATCK